MSNRLFTMIKSFVIPILAIVILLVVAGYALSGCQGGQTKSIQDRYPLESVAKEGKQESYVYRAANRSVPEVAKELINEREPKQASKEDENQMFLFILLQVINLLRKRGSVVQEKLRREDSVETEKWNLLFGLFCYGN